MKIIQLTGIPASGKSTYAAKLLREIPDAVVVNADKIRGQLNVNGDESDQSNNYKIFNEIIPDLIEVALTLNKVVILDNTAVNPKERRMGLEFGQRFNVPVECHYFEPNLEQAKTWNELRARKVPSFVFDKMLAKWVTPTEAEGFSKVICLTHTA